MSVPVCEAEREGGRRIEGLLFLLLLYIAVVFVFQARGVGGVRWVVMRLKMQLQCLWMFCVMDVCVCVCVLSINSVYLALCSFCLCCCRAEYSPAAPNQIGSRW